MKLVSRPWPSYLIRKIGELLLGFLGLLILTFLIAHLVPGDPARLVAGNEASIQDVEAVRERLGLNLPVVAQFLNYAGAVLGAGDLGVSFRTGEQVADIIASRLMYTLSVTAFAIVLTLVLAVAVGLLIAALTRGGRRLWLDRAFSWVTALFQSAPAYVVGALLVVVFAVNLHLLPAAGAAGPAAYVLPVVALSIGPSCAISRVVRREAAVVLEQDYMRTVRGWRIRAVREYLVYALPNLLSSTLTLAGIIIIGMLGGAIIMETVFSWPGLGNGIVEAILHKDYPVIRGMILTLGVLALVINLCIDLVLAALDPRVLLSKKGLAQ